MSRYVKQEQCGRSDGMHVKWVATKALNLALYERKINQYFCLTNSTTPSNRIGNTRPIRNSVMISMKIPIQREISMETQNCWWWFLIIPFHSPIEISPVFSFKIKAACAWRALRFNKTPIAWAELSFIVSFGTPKKTVSDNLPATINPTISMWFALKRRFLCWDSVVSSLSNVLRSDAYWLGSDYSAIEPFGIININYKMKTVCE